MSIMTAYDDISVTIEDCENVPISAILILPGGMVDVALSEFGASIVAVCLDEAQSLPVLHESLKSTGTS